MERGNLTESRSLDKELQESKGCWQRENKSFPRMSLLTGPFSTKWSALQSYTYKQNLMDTASVFIYLYIYVSVTIPIRNHEMERGRHGRCRMKGREELKWCSYILTIFFNVQDPVAAMAGFWWSFFSWSQTVTFLLHLHMSGSEDGWGSWVSWDLLIGL